MRVRENKEREGEVESIREWGNKKYNKMWKEKKRSLRKGEYEKRIERYY